LLFPDGLKEQPAMRVFLAAPFGFKDALMEQRYRQHFIESCVDRSGPILRCFWVPVIAALRLFWLVSWLLNPFKVTPVEVLIAVLRFSILVFVIFVIGKKWDDRTKGKFGLCLLWAARLVAILMALQQAVAKENDPQVMAGLVSFVCFCAMAIPSFIEYLCAALSLPFIQPIRLYLHGDMGEHVQQILFQHTLILALGLSISWTIHADTRRDWLRFPTAPAHKTTAARSTSSPTRDACARALKKGGSHIRAAAATAAAAAAAQEISSWDLLDDGYFTDADHAELRDDAVRVRRARRLPTVLTRYLL
jgi:hypothetical protein